MPLYQKHEATLGDIDGEGYAFRRRTVMGDVYKGVFFVDNEADVDLEALADEDKVEFSGVVYRKTRTGKIRERMTTFLVDVKNLVSVRIGERADFKVLEEVAA